MQKHLKNSARLDAIGVGFYSVDYLCVVPFTPGVNEKVRIKHFQIQTGGQTATAMVALQKWGLHTGFVGKLSDDTLGNLVKNELQAAGVDTSCIVVEEGGISHFAFIMIDEKCASRTIAWYREEKMHLSPSELVEEYIKSARMLHIDGHEFDAALCAAKWAKEAGAFVAMDAELVIDGIWELVEYVDALICTKEFALKATSKMEPIEAIRELRRRSKSLYIVITMGEEGCIGIEGEGAPLFLPSYKIEDIVDTTGAGDIFHAGFLYGYYKGWDFKKTLSFSTVAAALSCKVLGAQKGIPTLHEIFEHLKRYERNSS